MKKRLITSALPYVNNVPHLGNLIQVLSADVFARYCRQYGYETLYICGSDEYGTATETKALEEKVSPRELCDSYYKIHKDIYDWFRIEFDRFGRTSTPEQTEIVQEIFNGVDQNGYITERTMEQSYCSSCERYLADRYVHGICPKCGSEEARGDQCESCGTLLDPSELVSPRCGVCSATPEKRETRHLFLNLPVLEGRLNSWIDEASVCGKWAQNAVSMTKSWIRDGLRERCITRDLKWGVPVPKAGFEGKVFYVWFDAPIGYISITMGHTEEWKRWWKSPSDTELFQFIGKDNIPFHTVLFPASLLATGEEWTMLNHMSSSEYLNYEDGKFSKTRGVGIFGNDCMETGIPADVWRFYIFYNRPEKSDYQFTWKDFFEKVNGELIGNFANFVNRTVTFIHKFYNAVVPAGEVDPVFVEEVRLRETAIAEAFDGARLKEAFAGIFSLCSFGNKTFQEGEPWRLRKEDPDAAAMLICGLYHLVCDLAVMVRPFLPETSDRMAAFLVIDDFSWKKIGLFSGKGSIKQPQILFSPLDEKEIEALRDRFSGKQRDRDTEPVEVSLRDRFRNEIDLRLAKIKGVERHPDADKLYVETLDCGDGEERVIVSGIAPWYTPEELIGKGIILVANLKPAKLRGVKSQGMLLAANDASDTPDVFFVDGEPGDRILLKGDDPKASPAPAKRLSINHFAEIPFAVKDGLLCVDGEPLTINGNEIQAAKIVEGSVR